MAPMTRQFSPDGIPGEDVAAYYGRRAGSLGLLIPRAPTLMNRRALQPGAEVLRRRSLAGWRKVAEAVHEEGGAIFPQLWHLGAERKAGTRPYPTRR